MKQLVLVTGGTGFVGSQCTLQLLNAGYAVRTTLRSLKRKQEVIEMLKRGDVTSIEDLSFVEANLTTDTGWNDAVRGCEYVLHAATPISLEIPKHEGEVIRPAVEGTLRVLRAARQSGVKRVVLTSSFAAIGYTAKPDGQPYTEIDWTNPNDKSLSAYVKSKALSERAAWDFMKEEGGTMELAAINPMAIFGPLLGTDLSSGHQILKQLLDGSMKAAPRIDLGIVDVRDVADLHIRAMTHPKAAGERFLALAGGLMSFHEIARLLRTNLGEDASKVTEKVMPDWLVRFASLFSVRAKQIVPMLGHIRNASNEKAKAVLGWTARSNEEAVLAAAKSIIQLGLNKVTHD
jgi:nucleoside-diphosphate-sugar epimerase